MLVSHVLVAGASAAVIVNVAGTQSARVCRPGEADVPLFQLLLTSQHILAVTLRSATLTNRTSGPGGQAERDAEMGTLRLRLDDGDGVYQPARDPVVGTAVASAGRISFTGLAVVIPALGQVRLHLVADVSTLARDSDALDVSLDASSDLTFQPAPLVSGTFPIDPAGSFPVDGMSVVQVVVHPIAAATIPAGSTGVLALDVTLPANGYAPDVLDHLAVLNQGTAVAGADVASLSVFVDDGDGAFKPSADRGLGTLVSTGGGRWQITGLAEPVPVKGLRVFAVADIATFAGQDRTLALVLPGPPDPGVGVVSANDGPNDRATLPPGVLTISTSDRVTLGPLAVPPASAHPGDTSRVLARVHLDNRYSAIRHLTRLRFTNSTRGVGSLADLDRELERVALRLDGDGDGNLGTWSQDPLVGIAAFSSGRADFTGFSLALPASSARDVFLTGDLSSALAADGDSLSAILSGPLDVSFAESTRVAAAWPLDPGARLAVDGMVASQVTVHPSASLTLGPGDGPVLALDLAVPANGYLGDRLLGMEVANLGTAGPADLANVRFWRDGGDGAFTPASDADLGPLAWNGSRWTSGASLQSIPVGGARFFVSVTLAGSPTDSSTIRLALPPMGLVMESGDDGPLDGTVDGGTVLVVSNAPLIADLTISPRSTVVGQSATVRMRVRNNSPETIAGISPTSLAPSGSGAVSVTSGPAPASFDLAPAAVDSFTWTVRASGAGGVRLSGAARGTGQPSGVSRSSLFAVSPLHSVFDPASHVDLDATQSMPSTVQPGQGDVAAFSLTFVHPGGPSEAPIRIERLSFRLEDEAGAGIVPASLLARVSVRAGTLVAERDSLETSGATVDLPLDPPVVVRAGEATTLSLRFDVSDSASAPMFRFTVPDAAWLAASEEPTGRAVPISMRNGAFPFRTEVARLVLPARMLLASPGPLPDGRAGRGQTSVPLLELTLDNPGPDGTSAVRLAAVRVRLVDQAGVPLPRLADVVSRFLVQAGFQTLGTRTVYPADGAAVVVPLATPLVVSPGASTDMQMVADLASGAPLGTFRLEIPDSTALDARDGESEEPVPAVLSSTPLRGPHLRVEAVAETLLARGLPRFGPVTKIGRAGVPALSLSFRDAEFPATGPIRVDSLVVWLRDDQHRDLVPASVFDRIAVLRQGTEIGAVSALPVTAVPTAIPLSAPLFESGDTASFAVVVDVDANAPPLTIELSVPAAGVRAVDGNLGRAVALVPETGAELPAFSGLTRLEAPARELFVDLTSRMPVTLAADGRDVVAGTVHLRNPAPAGGDTLIVERLVVRAASASLDPLALGRGAGSLEAWVGGAARATSPPLAPDSVTATLDFGSGLAIPPGSPIDAEIRFRTVTAQPPSDFRLGLDSAGVVIRQPAGALLQIEARPEPGRAFPFWTEAGSFGASSLAGSLSNYPNPFHAGAEGTRFAYYLRTGGRVTLELATIDGEGVRTLLDHVARGPGMHETDSWDGRNGLGRVVRNGVYIANVLVEFDDGRSERAWRKVAVAR